MITHCLSIIFAGLFYWNQPGHLPFRLRFLVALPLPSALKTNQDISIRATDKNTKKLRSFQYLFRGKANGERQLQWTTKICATFREETFILSLLRRYGLHKEFYLGPILDTSGALGKFVRDSETDSSTLVCSDSAGFDRTCSLCRFPAQPATSPASLSFTTLITC